MGVFIDADLNDRLLGILSTKENVNLTTLGFDENRVKGLQAIITPIEIAGERLGTLFLYRQNEAYSIDDIILCEYGTTVVGLEMLRAVNEENAEEIRKVADVQSAMNTLSVSEMDAIVHIFEELNGMEGVLVASKIADRVGITRSVIVNALRKFESAGVIVSKSSGMKGTYIKVVNDAVYEEIANRVIAEEGLNYKVTVKIGKTFFETREYDDFTLPAGEYDALIVEIGEARGKNWWCVIFPGVCVPAQKANLKDSVGKKSAQIAENPRPYKIRFKSVEIYEKIKRKLK